MKQCPICKGRGHFLSSLHSTRNTSALYSVEDAKYDREHAPKCSICDGRGTLPPEWNGKKCHICSGMGSVEIYEFNPANPIYWIFFEKSTEQLKCLQCNGSGEGQKTKIKPTEEPEPGDDWRKCFFLPRHRVLGRQQWQARSRRNEVF